MNFKFLLKNIRTKWYPRRFFSSAETEQNVNSENYVSNLSQILGCSAGTASLLVTRNKKILTAGLNDVRKVALFCRGNFRLSEIIELPEVLSVSPYVLKDRATTLRELGCHTLTAGNVLFFNNFIQLTPVELHHKGFQMNPEAYFAHIASQLKCPDDVKLQMASKLRDLHSKNIVLLKMKTLINAIYLAWKFDFSEEKTMSLLHRSSDLCTKSLVSLETVYDVLLEKFHLPLKKAYGSLTLLTLDCDNLEELLVKVPAICGVGIQHVVRKHPSVLRRPVNSVIDILHVLENHNITAVQLLSCPKILNLSVSTISSRLDILKNSKNYETLKVHERFLWLVFQFNSVRENPELMEDLQSPKLPLNCKKLYPCNGRRSHMRDICLYLAVVFGSSTEDVKKELETSPRIYISSLGNVQKIIEYLTGEGITKEQLWNGVGIVLYDAEVVIEYFKKLPYREDLDPPFADWIGHHNIIQLLIYQIEKELNFTGNGVYMRSEDDKYSQNEEMLLDEEEEILALCSEDDHICNVNDMYY